MKLLVLWRVHKSHTNLPSVWRHVSTLLLCDGHSYLIKLKKKSYILHSFGQRDPKSVRAASSVIELRSSLTPE